MNIIQIWNEYDSDGSGFLEANELKVKFRGSQLFDQEIFLLGQIDNR